MYNAPLGMSVRSGMVAYAMGWSSVVKRKRGYIPRWKVIGGKITAWMKRAMMPLTDMIRPTARVVRPRPPERGWLHESEWQGAS